MRVDPEEWRPVGGIDDLEPNAWRALRDTGSVLVVAGPGAGKTEFLAQRAAYLLQTRACPPPHRILAISFKRDAARNLQERLNARCSPDESRRFTSTTFDSFAKGLVDRFRLALPEAWRPGPRFDVFLPARRDLRAFLTSTLVGAPPEWQQDVAALNEDTFEPMVVGQRRLPEAPVGPANGIDFACARWWAERHTNDSLSFTCLNRLAELAVRITPQVRRALLTTYRYVFVDEFQDTTYAQYDFLLALFGDSGTSVTAVGDDKQRIMSWAGARPDVFQAFDTDFHASRVALRLNFRSSPGLVRLQQFIAKAIDADSEEAESRATSEIDGDVAQIWVFPNPPSEAVGIAEWIASDMADRSLQPRDYCLVVRQRANDAEDRLKGAFAEHQLTIRNESRSIGRTSLQDLLAETITGLATSVLRLIVHERAPEAWILVSAELAALRDVDPDDVDGIRRIQRDLTGLIIEARAEYASDEPSAATAAGLVEAILKFLDLRALRRVYPEYSSGDNLDIQVEALRLHLMDSADQADDWEQCIQNFVGADAIPLMTIHKSKGLEYDTIVFLGLDDDSWWSRQAGDVEGLSTFFVGLTRAKQRVVFTYCGGRTTQRVTDIYALLADAGVPIIGR